jgi:hypothetical protein
MFQKTKGVARSTTWVETTSLYATNYINQTQRSYTKLCDHRSRALGGSTVTPVTLTFDASVTKTSQTFPEITAPVCSILDPVCQELYSVYDKSTFSYLSRTLFEFFTKAAGGNLPNIGFAHLQPPCNRVDACIPQSEIQYCKLTADRATVFYWPSPTAAPTGRGRRVCDRNPLTVNTAAFEDGPQSTATFKSITVTSPTPLVILRSLHAQILPTSAYNLMASQMGPRIDHNIFQGYFRGCGQRLDATMLVPLEEISSYRSAFSPSMVYPARGTSVSAATLYATTSSAYPLDFHDISPIESVPWDAVAGAAGCNTVRLAQIEKASRSRSEQGQPQPTDPPEQEDPDPQPTLYKRVPPPSKEEFEPITVVGDRMGAAQAAMMPPGNCPSTILPHQYTPILQVPKAATLLNPDYSICQPERIPNAVYIAITDTRLRMPSKTKFGVKVPPLPTSSTLERESIMRWMTAEDAAETPVAT